MIDKLIVSGLRTVDGEYDFDIRDLINIGGPGALDTREQHKIKLETGVLPANLPDAVAGLDASVMVQLASIVLVRHGKTVNEDRLWESRFIYGNERPELATGEPAVVFLIADRSEEEADEDPPQELPMTPQTEQLSPTGGPLSSSTSDPQETDQSPTGHPASLRSVISDPETLAS